jgi:PAS domain S-box-containing protein
VLALAGLGLTALLGLGHLYGNVFFGTRLPIGMAVHTSACLLAIAFGVLTIRPLRGVVAIIASEHSGGLLVRRLLIVSAIVVPVAGLLGVALEAAGIVPFPGASVLGAAISLGVILAAILVSGTRIGRVEAELQQWNEFVNAAPFGAVFCSPDGTLARVNDAFARMHHWAPEELVGRPFTAQFSPIERRALPDQLAMVERLGRHRFESVHLRRDGSTFPVVIDAAVIRDEHGDVLRRLAYVQDITAERRAREDQALLASLVASADDAIVATDREGKVLSWNRGAENLYG